MATAPDDLQAYIDVVQNASQTDDAAFNSVVARGMVVLRLLDSDLATNLGVSRPTVNRWTSGANAPHPAMRKHVFDWLKNRAIQLSRGRLGT
jgi:transcriptional regulator with XRE-family HTH domain